MKKMLIVVLAMTLIFGVLGPATVMADNTPEDMQYQEKDPIIGAGLAAVLPSAGHYYAEDWERSFRPLGVMGAGIGLNIASTFFWGTSPGIASALTAGGSLMLFGGWVWNIFDAYQAVEDYNEALYGFQPFIIPDLVSKDKGVSFGVNYTF